MTDILYYRDIFNFKSKSYAIKQISDVESINKDEPYNIINKEGNDYINTEINKFIEKKKTSAKIPLGDKLNLCLTIGKTNYNIEFELDINITGDDKAEKEKRRDIEIMFAQYWFYDIVSAKKNQQETIHYSLGGMYFNFRISQRATDDNTKSTKDSSENILYFALIGIDEKPGP
jgi:hypothetical protein